MPTVARARGADDVLGRIRAQVGRIVAADHHDLIGARLWSTNNQLLWGHGRAAATAVPYDGKIVWQYCGSWLRRDAGTGGNETDTRGGPQ